MAQRCIVCTSISKTFNLPGFQVANIIIINPEVRRLYNIQASKVGFWGPNVFTPVVTIAAYSPLSETWFKHVMIYIAKNLAHLRNFLQKNMKHIRLIEPEGTTLAWLDLRALGLSSLQINEKLILNGLALGDGADFGDPGKGFMRINLGCRLETIDLACKKMFATFYPPYDPKVVYHIDDHAFHDSKLWIAINEIPSAGDPNWAPGVAHSLWKLL